MQKKPIITILSFIFAIAFTVYIALDTFVISHVYTSVENPDTGVTVSSGNSSNSNSKSSCSSSDSTAVTNISTSDSAYNDDNISITLTEYREYDTNIYVADIILSSSKYLKTALAQDSYGKNITDTTSSIASDNNAILAINGDYYGVQESGYVIRNGVLYRDTSKSDQEDLVIYTDGSMELINEDDITAQELLDNGAYNVLSFGPGLIENGQIAVGTDDEVAKAMASNPRTAIGILDDLHYVFVVADGRTSQSTGLSLYQLAEFMQSLDVTTAYNLDGGGSSTMVFNGNVINNPTSGSFGYKSKSGNTASGERSVSDIVYIGY